MDICKVDKLYLSGKAMVIHLIAGLIKNILIHKSSYYPQPKNHIWNKIKVELNLSNYAKKKKNKEKKKPPNRLIHQDLARLKIDVNKLNWKLFQMI